jgi:hypothetical protein
METKAQRIRDIGGIVLMVLGIAVVALLLWNAYAHAQAVGGLGDPIAMATTGVTYLVRLAQICVGGAAVYMGYEHWRGHQLMRCIGDLFGGTALAIGVPTLLGLG